MLPPELWLRVLASLPTEAKKALWAVVHKQVRPCVTTATFQDDTQRLPPVFPERSRYPCLSDTRLVVTDRQVADFFLKQHSLLLTCQSAELVVMTVTHNLSSIIRMSYITRIIIKLAAQEQADVLSEIVPKMPHLHTLSVSALSHSPCQLTMRHPNLQAATVLRVQLTLDTPQLRDIRHTSAVAVVLTTPLLHISSLDLSPVPPNVGNIMQSKLTSLHLRSARQTDAALHLTTHHLPRLMQAYLGNLRLSTPSAFHNFPALQRLALIDCQLLSLPPAALYTSFVNHPQLQTCTLVNSDAEDQDIAAWTVVASQPGMTSYIEEDPNIINVIFQRSAM